MTKNVVGGLVLAVMAALVVGLGEFLGLDLQHVALLGAALGGVIGLVPDRAPWERIVGFAVGFVFAWIGFAVRAAVLPDSSGGRAVAAFLVLAASAWWSSAATLTRLPLWSMLVGAAAIVGAYEETYTNAPSQFVHESPTAATTVLLAAALGYLATAFLGPQIAVSRRAEAAHTPATTRPFRRPRRDPSPVHRLPPRAGRCRGSGRPAPRRRPGPGRDRRHGVEHRDHPGPPRRVGQGQGQARLRAAGLHQPGQASTSPTPSRPTACATSTASAASTSRTASSSPRSTSAARSGCARSATSPRSCPSRSRSRTRSTASR